MPGCAKIETDRALKALLNAGQVDKAIGDGVTFVATKAQAAKSAQAAGDALCWPIYNPDSKNPHAKAGVEHAAPEDLIAAMRGHEVEVMRLLSEIEALVNEVEQ